MALLWGGFGDDAPACDGPDRDRDDGACDTCGAPIELETIVVNRSGAYCSETCAASAASDGDDGSLFDEAAE